jgi:hypothetical protein
MTMQSENFFVNKTSDVVQSLTMQNMYLLRELQHENKSKLALLAYSDSVHNHVDSLHELVRNISKLCAMISDELDNRNVELSAAMAEVVALTVSDAASELESFQKFDGKFCRSFQDIVTGSPAAGRAGVD